MGFAPIGGGSGLGSAIGRAVGGAVKSKPVRRAVKPRRSGGGSSHGGSGNSGRGYSPPRRSGGGGSSGGEGGGHSSPKSSPVKPPKPRVSIPSINSYLGTDASYQNIVRGSKRSLADFISEMGRRRGESTTQFNQTRSSMERDRVQQLDDLKNEFASRGLIQSGLYGDEQGKFQKQFTEQSTALQQQQAALLADLLSQEKNYRREQDLALETARQDALARRAAKFKIGA